VVTFSNAICPVPLVLANGRDAYSGTWTPRSKSGQVTITSMVTAPGFSSAVAMITGEVFANSAPLLRPAARFNLHPLDGAAIGQGTILQIYGSGLGASPAQATTVR